MIYQSIHSTGHEVFDSAECKREIGGTGVKS